MKKFLTIMLAVLMALPFMASCQKEEATLTTNGETVSKIVVKSFEKKYPTATNVIWENKSPYWVAHFDMPTTKAVAADPRTNSTWFDNSGNWQMSEHDIDYAELPQPIKDSFEASKYAAWEKDDVQTLERDGVIALYMIEVEQDNGKEEIEIELYYTADGILTKEVPATEDHTDLIPEELPAAIVDDLKAKYGEFEAIEAEMEDGEFEVEILAEGRVYELKYIMEPFQWISTEYDITPEELPAEILNLIKENVQNFEGFEFDDIEIVETKDGKSYEIELENKTTDEEIEILINEKGEITIK